MWVQVRYGWPMRRLTDETVMAVGRLTLAATELEYLLAGIGASQADDDCAAIFTAADEPLRTARRSAQLASPDHRDEFTGLIEAAATYLAQGRTAVRAMWFENGLVSAATFDEISSLILRCRDRLQALLDELDGTPAALPRSR